MSNEQATVTFNRDKETPKKIRFSTDEDAQYSGSLYVKKADAGDHKSIRATLQFA